MSLYSLRRTLASKTYENSILLYRLYSYFLRKYEKACEKNTQKALKKMVNLYIKVNYTCFHDLADGIGLWMEHFGDNTILEYIQNKRNNGLTTLKDIIKNKLQKECEMRMQ